mgnify:FL=1
MTRPHLLLRLEAPLMAFGAVAVDAYGPVQDIPPPSLLTGLLGNALGWDRAETDRLDALQERITLAARRDRQGERFEDFQTAQLAADDQGWTTWGRPEGRDGGAATYNSPHIRRRWFDADAAVTVALRLDPPAAAPTLEALAAALDRPARPLFLGRKPCLPAGRIVIGIVAAANCLAALDGAPWAEASGAKARLFWPEGEAPASRAPHRLHGYRRWRSGVHAGEGLWWEGEVANPNPA